MGVQFFTPDPPQLARTLRARLQQQKQQFVGQLLLASSWDDFKARSGRIQGIDDAIALCEQIEKEQDR
jgi:hypothetical protein